MSSGWEWREIQTPSAQSQPVRVHLLQLLIPFMGAGLLYLWGRVLFGSVVAGIGLFLLLLKFRAPYTYESILTLLSALGRWLGKVMSYAALTLVYGLVFTPVALLARLLRRDALALVRQPSASTYWSDIPPRDPTHLFARPFLAEARQGERDAGSRKIWRVGKALYRTALTLFFLNFALVYFYQSVRDVLKQDPLDPRSQLAVYKNDGWAKDYFKEFAETSVQIYKPFIGWVRKDYQGRYINIKNGLRQGYHPSLGSRPALRLYAFGGSTMWGTGARDDYTIPSYLARLAEQEGLRLEAQNFGEMAFVSWQNVLRLAELCAEGQVPAFVVFYDGANDVFAKIQTPSLKRVHHNFSDWQKWIEQHDSAQDWLQEHSLLHIVGRSLGHGLQERRARETELSTDPERVQQLARDIVMVYGENVELVRKLAAVYGFKVWFFWQPVVFTKNTPTEIERAYERRQGKLMADIYRAATEEIRSHRFVIDLSKSFDDYKQTIYIDWAHITETGNQMIARNMYGYIRPTLHAFAHPSRPMRQTNEHRRN
ncbi:MAG: hypothetical protein HYY20_08400 [Candidatus Tectomicrobia bacterium]|uniref:SGNH hydrolase-type esterase domain-containing protein n=1 Tax=Tectimicrobiota bacterium TaxID=2528274 RepID=A0A932CPF5_UNCTE|nr:hypothetical protein [Candidatus Tectomicrobia bacterium]